MGLGGNNYNNIDNINANNNFNNNGRARGIASLSLGIFMKTYKQLFEKLISMENLENAYWNARKGKSNNLAICEFEKHWQLYLVTLHAELKNKTYQPKPLKTFVLRDPKTRTICVSNFRDRIVHHALVNVLQPIFESRFIHDSYASRKGKGTLPALKRFDTFLRKVTQNGKLVPGARNANAVCGYALKADIKHYFDTVDHAVLLNSISKRIKDYGVLWLVKIILEHYNSGIPGKGMPLGNWTSQFFANVYLNELDQYVKHKLKAKYYIRYVDDFVILNKSKTTLQEHLAQIRKFLATLEIELHPTKCAIMPLSQGVGLLGFKVFYTHKRIRRRNILKIYRRISELLDNYKMKTINCQDVLDVLQGWNAYAMHANTYHLRQRITAIVEQELES